MLGCPRRYPRRTGSGAISCPLGPALELLSPEGPQDPEPLHNPTEAKQRVPQAARGRLTSRLPGPAPGQGRDLEFDCLKLTQNRH